MKKNAIRVIFGFVSLYLLAGTVFAADMLIPVGRVIGLDLYSSTVTVAAFDDTVCAARESGLQVGDSVVVVTLERGLHDVRDILAH